MQYCIQFAHLGSHRSPNARPTARRAALTFLTIAVTTAPLAAQQRDRAAIGQAIDSVVASYLKDGRAAGMSVAVVRGRDTLAMKGYGSADLELEVPTPPRAVYEIGSVTKQFTAVAILQLQDEGKLSLDDDLSKYLPDYPTQGHRITVRRLLDHTSGIKGYTEIPAFGAIMSRKLPKDSLVALFKKEKFDFEPGEAMVYNNSAYFLAGLIIEKLSGMSYADYVKKNLFDKVGMPDSRYCSESAVIKRKAHGYDMGPGGLQNKGFIDHTYPYAAGSLCSTVGDLVAWNRALHGGKLLSERGYKELVAPGTLNDGTALRYTKGLALHSLAGHRVIEHGGGINGYRSASAYLPDDDVVIVVLINTGGPVSPGRRCQLDRRSHAREDCAQGSVIFRRSRGVGRDLRGCRTGTSPELSRRRRRIQADAFSPRIAEARRAPVCRQRDLGIRRQPDHLRARGWQGRQAARGHGLRLFGPEPPTLNSGEGGRGKGEASPRDSRRPQNTRGSVIAGGPRDCCW